MLLKDLVIFYLLLVIPLTFRDCSRMTIIRVFEHLPANLNNEEDEGKNFDHTRDGHSLMSTKTSTFQETFNIPFLLLFTCIYVVHKQYAIICLELYQI